MYMNINKMKATLINTTKVENSTKEDKATDKAKNKALEKLMNDINKKYGENSVRVASDILVERAKRIPTGSIALDIALGGGIPLGRFTQISGAYSSTKTTQTLHIIAKAQEQGLTCAMFDVEGTTDKDYMKQIGIDVDNILFVKPSGLEECTQMILDMQESGVVQLAVMDSIASLFPLKELNSDMDETVQMGTKQKLLGEFLGKYQSINNKLERRGDIPFTLIAINQIREKIGSYGDPEYTPGGRAIGFYASVDIRLRRGDWLKQGKGDNAEIVGQVVKFKIEKNKTYKRMQTGEFDFFFSENDTAIPVGHNDNFKSVIIEGIAWGLIERGGAWFYLDKENGVKFQGVDALISHLRENPQIVEDLKVKILELADTSK